MGDKNTRFFHLSVSLRKGRNYIRKIEQNGSRLVSLNNVKEGVANSSSTLFRKPKCKRIEMGHLRFSKISEAKLFWLERSPLIEEVKQVVWDCNGSKTPGLDGYTFSFNKKILDGFMIAKRLFMASATRSIALLLKVDFYKAFNSILWEHIDISMGYMGFGSHWRKLVFECLSTSKLAILINGSPNREFSMERGLRHGDPLSPFLFDIVVQGLTVLLNKALASGYFKKLANFSRTLHNSFVIC
ncbi:uncharacterized protein [Populus alba]|uniref:uncharacterized protein n=1 Tax=Populus alba TaxID=43335 RepID=UPI00158B521E|nr:uncharacterized protein LOC118055409 [Populus alba]